VVTPPVVAGVIVAAVSVIVHVAMIAAHPVWSVLVVAFDVVVIYALLVHGGEMMTANPRQEEQT
jgi:hypothetical protein